MKTEEQIRKQLTHVLKSIEALEANGGAYKNTLELQRLYAKKNSLDWVLGNN